MAEKPVATEVVGSAGGFGVLNVIVGVPLAGNA
jgi:hypothetical protein